MRAPDCPKSLTLRRELHSNPGEVDAFCEDAREFLTQAGFTDERFGVELLLRESLNNAMVHGNLSNGEKRIWAQVRIGKRGILVRVKDEGAGFDCSKPRGDLPDPGATCGRGLAIFSLYAHRVAFNSKGNQVCLWRAVKGKEDV